MQVSNNEDIKQRLVNSDKPLTQHLKGAILVFPQVM